MGVRAVYDDLARRLRGVVPDVELRLAAEVAQEVLELKACRGAVILAHNYMEPALFHSVPDFCGDSLELARRAAATEAPVLVFCGVRFMAETAKILSPDKRVLLPSLEAGCSLAESVSAADVRRLRRRFPGVPVVAYVNTYADVKAEADICCTSANAVAVVEALDAATVILLPDEFLARNVARETGKTILLANGYPVESGQDPPGLVGWPGRCEVHEKFTVEDVLAVRQQFPDVMVLAHPECHPEVVAAADYSGGTAGMIRRVEESDAGRYLLLTECSMADNVAAARPDKEMLRLCSVRCPHMARISLASTRDALKLDRWAIEVPEPVCSRARRAVERMLEVA